MKQLCTIIFLIVSMANSVIAQKGERELRHVVLFGWKDGTDSSAIQKVITAFNELPTQISAIKKFEWGKNNSPENLNQGLTYCFLLTFSSEKDRDEYLVHPAHKAFTQLLPNILEKVTVFDYWVQ